MATSAPLRRRLDYAGPALFSYGFRPFFLGGALWAILALALWLPQYAGLFSLPTALTPLDWHIHEMLYGYVAAVVAGFMLTAISNWTGRLPISGWPLAALFGLWAAGRVVMLVSSWTGLPVAASVDVLFLVALAAVAAREIVAGRNWRNLRVLVVLCMLIAGNIVFQAELLTSGVADWGIRLGVAATIMLIMLIGGRIVPSFTRNWLARRVPGRLPAPFSRFDGTALAGSAAALIGWVAVPESRMVAGLMLVAALLQTIRLARWAGERTFADRLVLVLHVAYAFIPLGFALVGASILWPDLMPRSAGIHTWTAGAIGMMPLAVMTRASLGHTGQALAATAGTQAIYACALLGALARILASVTASKTLMDVAALGWIVAFAGFAILYGPLLVRRPPVWANRC
ncbi:MAG: NnrS family protein [Pseudorhodoplanes sp.]|nr:NnrS family protein [Pseudorhodoplanes sp.]